MSLFKPLKQARQIDSDDSSDDDAPVVRSSRKQVQSKKRAAPVSDDENESNDSYYDVDDEGQSVDESEQESEEVDESDEELERELAEVPLADLREIKKPEAGPRRQGKKTVSDIEKLKLSVSKQLGLKKGSESEKKPSTSKKGQRRDKDAPAVMDARKPVSRFQVAVQTEKKRDVRDPRFDTLSGSFNESLFSKSYGFIDGIRKNELAELKEAIKKEKDYATRQELKQAMQVMTNKIKAQEANDRRRKLMQQHKKKERDQIKEGKNPYFLKKKSVKELELTEKFNELKKKGGLKEVDRYMTNKRRKQASKDHKFLPFKRRAMAGEDGSAEF